MSKIPMENIHIRVPNSDSKYLIDGLVIDDRSILIWGAGFQSTIALDALSEANGYRAIVLVDQSPQSARATGIPVLAPSCLPMLYDRGLRKAHICIGSPKVKIEVAGKLKEAGFSFVNIIHPSAVVSKSASLGEGVFVGPQVIVGPEARIEDFCQLNNAASVAHHSVIGRAVQVSDGARIGGAVRIGEGSLVGFGVVVGFRVTVDPWSTIRSGTTL
jgi:UDP-perosamine 4-acetyltransferase